MRSSNKTLPYLNITIALFLSFLFINDTYAQSQLQFTQLTQSFTNTILKDSDGFIWVGTQDGLLRYDNFGFKEYRYNRG